ncbi:LacI family transcriptional regulator [Paraoerskovia sediminicola]|uniref:LacI family transcriptional regulator n=1 Tax=Paraoerskovia sediminicola TaxID=1138587 RepID=A0ABN6XCA9_9CELL|nr:LacI family transcriptional regulator [Paraoerskovia sediminicola]
MTIGDVARTAGVSVATVSKVINERYGVSAATSAKVKAVVAELGYETSLVARSLRGSRTNVIGVLVPGFEPFSTELLKGISDAVAETDYELLAYSPSTPSDRAVGWEHRSLARLSGTLIDGAIMVTPTIVGADTHVPVVAIDPHTGPQGLPTVDADSATGAFDATTHLAGLGHRRIAYLGGRPDLESARLREEGYRAALESAGIPFDPDLTRVGAYHAPTADGPLHELMTLADRPTALFAANDLSAIRAVEVARELGLRVPEDLSIVGFDNVPESALVDPPLTTVQQPMHQMGAEALRMLLDLLAGVERDAHLRLPTSLVVRASTAPPAPPAPPAPSL